MSMLKQKKFLVASLAATLVVGVAGVVYMITPSASENLEEPVKQTVEATKHQKRPRRARKSLRVAKDVETAERIEMPARTGVKFNFDAEEEAKLTEEQRKLLAELRAALDDEQLKRVRAVSDKIQAMGLDNVPPFLQKEVIDALGWFDSKTMPELLGYLGSPDDEVRESAAEELLSALDDESLGDRAIKESVVSLAKVLTDEDMLEDLFAYFDRMRNSEAVDGFKAIMASGSAKAKEMLPDAIADFTDAEGIVTQQQLDEWLQANPDGDDDDNFYGGDDGSDDTVDGDDDDDDDDD